MSSRDTAGATTPNQLLRSVIRTKSAVVDRLSSGIGQLVDVVSGGQSSIQNVQTGDDKVQCEGQGRVQDFVQSSYGNPAVSGVGRILPDTATVEDAMPLDAVRATFAWKLQKITRLQCKCLTFRVILPYCCNP